MKEKAKVRRRPDKRSAVALVDRSRVHKLIRKLTLGSRA
jgi:hypothetical protein